MTKLEDIIQETIANMHKIHMIGHMHKIISNKGILLLVLMKGSQREVLTNKAFIIGIKVLLDTKSIIL